MNNKPCKYCGSIYHFPFQCYDNPKRKLKSDKPAKKHKPMKTVSKKQQNHKKWIREVAYPYLIERDGDKCNCCDRWNEHYDVDHIKGVGSHPDLKNDLNNLQLLCRFPCHRLKTDNKKCTH